MKPFLRLKSVAEVEDIIFQLPMLEAETISLKNAVGRRLAKPFAAPADLPGFRRSTMDGYAVQARDVFGASENNPALLNICGACVMGKMPDFSLAEGMAAPISTGAPLPEGADAVVMIEHTRAAGEGLIEVTRSMAPGANVIEKNDDAGIGQPLLSPARALRPQDIGILAAFGISSLEVIRTAKVAIISTGDEIIDMESQPEPGQIRDVNTWSLAAFCQSHGSDVIPMGIVPDEPKPFRETLIQAKDQADVILVSGGSSAGMRDHTIEAFQSLPNAEILVHGVAIRPGKPFIAGVADKTCLIGLPGHVGSALVCAHVFLAPLLKHLQGLPKPNSKTWIEASLSRFVASGHGRQDYIPCRLEKNGEGFTAIPTIGSSAVLASLLEADGFIISPEDSEGFRCGQKVRFYLFREF